MLQAKNSLRDKSVAVVFLPLFEPFFANTNLWALGKSLALRVNFAIRLPEQEDKFALEPDLELSVEVYSLRLWW